MKQFCVAFIVLIMSAQAFSQSHFKPGYIITNQNDSINGYINYRSNNKNTFECEFKKDIHSESQKYSANDILAYRFTGSKYYVSHKLHSNDSANIFLEYLIDGIVDLFFYCDSKGEHYLIQKENESLVEMTNEYKPVYKNGNQFAYNTKQYVGILKNTFKDCPEILDEVEDVSFYQNQLIRITKDYHNEVCDDKSCIVYSKNKSKLLFNYGVIAGVSIPKLSFKHLKLMEDLNDDLTSTTPLNFGAFITVADPQISEKISLYGEASFEKNKFTADAVDISYTSLKVIPLAIRYAVPEQKISPVFMFGLIINNMLNLKNTGILEDTNCIEKGRLQAGVVGGIGTEFNIFSDSRIFFMVRGEYLGGEHYNVWRTLATGGNETHADFKSRTTSINFSIGIKL
ncbi:hypothetical protein [uncultured Draconibacterium sp.]|uniref:hypothetical protein n=1 Tax=uncultured Draconibacterium sp. TaxID=1573823 RepID=UPI0032179C8D